MAWDYYIVCPACERKARAPFASAVHVHFDCCPRCGTRKPDGFRTGGDEWTMVRMRWVDTVVWWKLSTWGTGYWEVHEDDHKKLPEASCYLKSA